MLGLAIFYGRSRLILGFLVPACFSILGIYSSSSFVLCLIIWQPSFPLHCLPFTFCGSSTVSGSYTYLWSQWMVWDRKKKKLGAGHSVKVSHVVTGTQLTSPLPLGVCISRQTQELGLGIKHRYSDVGCGWLSYLLNACPHCFLFGISAMSQFHRGESLPPCFFHLWNLLDGSVMGWQTEQWSLWLGHSFR